MCGFTEVVVNDDGVYYCSVCRKNLGKNFRNMIKATSPELLKSLDEQCKEPKNVSYLRPSNLAL